MAGRPVPYQMILDGDRVWRRNRPTDQKSQWSLEVIVPEVGRTDGDQKRSFEAVKLETVETPAGVFKDCVLLRITEEGRILSCWYAPLVGLVKRVNEATGISEMLLSHVVP